jgi:uncharacterized membrane protein
MKKLLFFYKELIATFWFIPVLIIGLSVILSVGLVSLDNFIDVSQKGWFQFFLVNSSDSARSILSTISAAMIGVAGTVFSVTLVALTLASSQFGPRLIKNFMYVRLNQIVLGSYIATYLYCLLVLMAVKDGSNYTFIPSISILVAIIAAIANIILLIIFIHQIAVSIQADKVIADISDFISHQIKTLFPEKMEEEDSENDTVNVSAAQAKFKESKPIRSPESGYLQYVDNESLIEFITEQDAFFKLYFRPGSYLVKGMEIGEIYSNTPWEKETFEKIDKHFVIGKTKTSQQDLEFSVHQMVEIASRALSSGINDPYTAIACIDNLTTTMSNLAQVKFHSKCKYDEEGKLRIVADVLDFEGVLDAAFNQIRQFSEGSTAVIIRLMEAMITIHGFTVKASHKKALKKHAQMVLNVGKQTIKEDNDIQDLIERSEKILK